MDNCVQVVLSEMDFLLSMRGIKRKKCTLYHLDTNRIVGRFNSIIKENIQIARMHVRDWREETVSRFEIYRLTPHSVTGRVSFKLF